MERIQCTVCPKEMRKSKNKMERHWRSHHGDRLDRGEKVSYQLPTQGTSSLELFGFKKTDSKRKSDQEIEKEINVVEESKMKDDQENNKEMREEGNLQDMENVAIGVGVEEGQQLEEHRTRKRSRSYEEDETQAKKSKDNIA